jgi:hypothetical protein
MRLVQALKPHHSFVYALYLMCFLNDAGSYSGYLATVIDE